MLTRRRLRSGWLFSTSVAVLAASRALGAIAAVLQDTQNGPASAADARRVLRGGWTRVGFVLTCRRAQRTAVS